MVVIKSIGFSSNGGGPWRILPECPGLTHNSVRAAQGKVGNIERARPKCVCPQALVVLVGVIAARKVREAGRLAALHEQNREQVRKDPRTRLMRLAAEPTGTRSPNFLTGSCTTPGGRKAADAGMNDQASPNGIKSRALAKSWCENCLMKPECREWVTTQEKPAGSWGGVWGGLDPWNRQGLELVIRNGKAEVIPYVHVS